MPTLEFVGQSAQDPDNKSANTSRLVNLYRQSVDGVIVLKSVLGTQAFADLDGVFMRAALPVGDYIYAAHGGQLWRVSYTGGATAIGAIANEPTGISSNNGKVTLTAGGSYHVWDGTTLSEPGGGPFASYGDVTFIGQRTVITEASGRQFTWTDLADPETFSGDTATAEQRDDEILRCFEVGGLLWHFKEKSIERWQPTATGFSYVSGLIDRGLKAKALAVRVPNGVFFVGNDNRAYIAAGGTLSPPLSNRAVETAVVQGEPTACFYYADEGQEFCVIRFGDRPSWVLDIATGEWDERAEGHDNPWRAVLSVRAFDRQFIGNDLGALQELVRNNEDVDGPLIRQATSRTLRIDGKRFRVPFLEFMGRVGKSYLGREDYVVLTDSGFALNTGDGSVLVEGRDASPRDASLMLEVSRDRGHTWTAPKVRSMGDQGDYEQTIRFRALGQARNLTVRVTISDPADLTLNAEATL